VLLQIGCGLFSPKHTLKFDPQCNGVERWEDISRYLCHMSFSLTKRLMPLSRDLVSSHGSEFLGLAITRADC
jgi:hypothetical protein